MALGGAVSGCIGLLAPKFLPNASGGRNGEGLEGGGWVVEEGGELLQLFLLLLFRSHARTLIFQKRSL